jgi:hypothetical protein
MRIYNFLFYYSYVLAQRSRNFDDIPALGGLIFVAACIMLNIFTIVGFIEGLGINTGIEFKKQYKYLFSLSLVGALLFYYMYNGRYKRIIEKFRNNDSRINIHPIIVIILYYGISVFLMFLAATFKNHDWIFSDR